MRIGLCDVRGAALQINEPRMNSDGHGGQQGVFAAVRRYLYDVVIHLVLATVRVWP